MNVHNGARSENVSPELLAAYVDGELTPAECLRIEAWLAEHPEARADVEEQRRLLRCLEETAPALPAEERWAETLAKVEKALAAPPPRRLTWPRRAAVAIAGLAAAAALLWAAVWLNQPPPQGQPHDTSRDMAEEEWQVVSPDDIEIISMDARDRGALVVGEPPVDEPLQLLMPDEVQVNQLPVWQDRIARQFLEPGSPVIVSLDADPDDDR
jgi:anti-sigma factor RsiW